MLSGEFGLRGSYIMAWTGVLRSSDYARGWPKQTVRILSWDAGAASNRTRHANVNYSTTTRNSDVLCDLVDH